MSACLVPLGYRNQSLDSVAPCGATMFSKIHGFFLYVTNLLIFSKRVYGGYDFSKRENDTIRQTSNSVQSILGGAGVVCRGGGTVKDVRSRVVGVIKESILKQL